MKVIKKILIANRGEIACRIIRTAKNLNIACIAVYSDIDKEALYVKMADEAYWLGPAPSKESYLNIPRIIEIAKHAKADAIHPGYGFLSENPEFAALCKEQKIVFIGPSADSIRKMGIKHEAKKLVQAFHVPTIPGYLGEKQDIETLKKEALKIGLPVLFKASYGGGGKGMRIAYLEAELEESIRGAKAESVKSFGNDALFIEKYLPESRHVEVQIFGDRQGNYVHLYDRDCSLQRRHQKVIEEGPAVNIPSEIKFKLYEAAINAAKSVNYLGAGTVEFLFSPDNHFYFMEMNTRLQVEHPVTEMITSLDLVEWQIKIAQGDPLPLSQEEIVCQGVAVEARIYAEDPEQHFLPTTGYIQHAIWPSLSDKSIRVDSGYDTGDTIQLYYDPLIAKIIIHAKDRKTAYQKLHKALTHTAFIGLKNNIEFLQKLCSHTDILNSDQSLSTHWLNTNLPALLKKHQATVSTELLAITALFYYKNKIQSSQNRFAGFRLNRLLPITELIPLGYFNTEKNKLDYYLANIFDLGENTLEISIRSINNLETKTFYVSGKIKDNQLVISLAKHDAYKNKIESALYFYFHHNILYLLWNGKLVDIHLLVPDYYHYHGRQLASLLGTHNHSLSSPMPGIITQIWVKAHEPIQKGDKIMALEAMKMEHIITAPYSGTIQQIYYSIGDQVAQGADLIAIE